MSGDDAPGINRVGVALSGGSGNTNVAASLGGQPNFTQRMDFFSPVLAKLFPDVTKEQALNGTVQHRCLYVWCDGHIGQNQGPGTWSDVRIFIVQKHQEALDEIWMGNGAAPASNRKSDGFSWEQEIENEFQAPQFVTFSSENDTYDYNFGVRIGDIPGDPEGPYFKSFWIKRVVHAGTLSLNGSYFTIIVRGRKVPAP